MSRGEPPDPLLLETSLRSVLLPCSARIAWTDAQILHFSMLTGLVLSDSCLKAIPQQWPGAKTINIFRACLGAQLTICAQKWRNFVLGKQASRLSENTNCVPLDSIVTVLVVIILAKRYQWCSAGGHLHVRSKHGLVNLWGRVLGPSFSEYHIFDDFAALQVETLH